MHRNNYFRFMSIVVVYTDLKVPRKLKKEYKQIDSWNMWWFVWEHGIYLKFWIWYKWHISITKTGFWIWLSSMTFIYKPKFENLKWQLILCHLKYIIMNFMFPNTILYHLGIYLFGKVFVLESVFSVMVFHPWGYWRDVLPNIYRNIRPMAESVANLLWTTPCLFNLPVNSGLTCYDSLCCFVLCIVLWAIWSTWSYSLIN